MENMSLNKILEQCFIKNWDRPALSDYKGVTIYYRDLARKIEKIHIVFENCGIKKGDKISICSKSQSNWAVTFLACITYGAVPVPILHEFKASNIHHIVNHSESKVLFVGDYILETLTQSMMPNLDAIILLTDFSLVHSPNKKVKDAVENLNALFGNKFPKNFSQEDINYYADSPDELAMINYTSGTSGFSKGVMLPFRSLISNILFAMQVEPHMNNTSSSVAMLPTAHMYGMMFEFLFEISIGAHIHFLTRLPTPKIILEAFENVRPDIIVAVPLVIEKIYKKKLEPMINRADLKLMLKLPVLDQQIHRKINQELDISFGNRFSEVIIGGAAFNKEAEAFFKKIGFRYTVGYGMTECGPIISYSPWNEAKLYSCGKAAPRMQIKIDSEDPVNIPGEILVKGDNVFLGYFKNTEATAAAFTSDSWFRTGDLGIMDEEGYLFIKGRCKSMILGPSGQNIYPEEIESEINNMPYVSESLVIDDNGQLVALIYPDMDIVERDKIDTKTLLEKYMTSIKELNMSIPSYSQISDVEIFPEEFEKTPKRSIKRYLYQRERK